MILTWILTCAILICSRRSVRSCQSDIDIRQSNIDIRQSDIDIRQSNIASIASEESQLCVWCVVCLSSLNCLRLVMRLRCLNCLECVMRLRCLKTQLSRVRHVSQVPVPVPKECKIKCCVSVVAHCLCFNALFATCFRAWPQMMSLFSSLCESLSHSPSLIHTHTHTHTHPISLLLHRSISTSLPCLSDTPANRRW